jgi:phenylpropionate dioxygenase-like ring-hydroxylating dioxygenase large terminal subunit
VTGGNGISAHLARPSGWFQIGWSAEYPAGTVRPLRYFGRDLVGYRGEAGLAVLDGHCPHMGAHLGHGGVVRGDDIECPFHGWRWSPDGRNTAIAGTDRTLPRLCARSWPVRERSGVVYLWHDETGAAPYYDPPHIPEAGHPDWYQAWPGAVHTVESARLFPQYVLENTVDLTHLRFVHGWDDVPVTEDFAAGEASFRSSFGGHLTTRTGRAPIRNTTEAWGVSCMLSRLEGLRETVQLMCTTPVDDNTCDVRFSVFVRRAPDDPPGETPGLVRAIVRAQTEGEWAKDAPIWEHLAYVDNPAVIGDEAAAFVALRRWSRRFYPLVAAT